MLTIQQILPLLIAAIPYILLFVYLAASKKITQISTSTVFLGIFDIVLAFGGGVIALVLISGSFPQTNSTLSNSFLIGAFAAMMAVALIIGELFRFIVLKNDKSDEKTPLAGLSFGLGISLGEFVFFTAMTVLNVDYSVSYDMALILLVDILIQLGVSVVAYQLIKDENYASFLVGGIYYLSLFLMMAFNSSTILTIVFKVVSLLVVVGLVAAYLPTKFKSTGEN